MVEKIIGKSTYRDSEYVERFNYTEYEDAIQNIRNSIDSAARWVENRDYNKSISYGAGMIVVAFMIGAGLVGTIWYLFSSGILK